MDDAMEELAELLKAMAHPTRLQILTLLDAALGEVDAARFLALPDCSCPACASPARIDAQ